MAIDGTVYNSDWRRHITSSDSLQRATNVGSHMHSEDSKVIRNMFRLFFNSEVESIPRQFLIVNRGSLD